MNNGKPTCGDCGKMYNSQADLITHQVINKKKLFFYFYWFWIFLEK